MGTALSFDSMLFELKYRIPSYQKWHAKRDKTLVYNEHKLMLQYLQAKTNKKRWVLKAPAHISELDQILRVYPDALFIHTHRAVDKVTASASSMYKAVREGFSRQVDLTQLGKEVCEVWAERLNKGLAFRDANPDINRKIVDSDFGEFMKSPVDHVAHIYDQLGIKLTTESRNEIVNFVEKNQRRKHGTHNYKMADFGITENMLKEHFGEYQCRYISTNADYT